MAVGKRRPKHSSPDLLPPTPERLARGPVELLEHAIADDDGRPSRPYRSIDILAAMNRRGAITATMRAACETFRQKFNLAHLNQLRAADPSRAPGGKGPIEPSLAAHAAREHVWRATCAV